MADLVGVRRDAMLWHSRPDLLKQHLLFFDRLLARHFSASSSAPPPPTFVHLMTRGVMIEAPPPGTRRLSDDAFSRANRIFWDAIEAHLLRKPNVLVPVMSDVESRLLANAVHDTIGLNAVPILDHDRSFGDPPTARSHVIRLVLREIPQPADDESLDDVLAFRDEMRDLGLPQSLRVWMNETASAKLTPIEVSDKLEDLVSRYERALRLERLGRTTGVVETIVTTTAEIAESLVTFQWSRVAKKLFEVRHKQLDLMKTEMRLPGREIAYIVKARERFGS